MVPRVLAARKRNEFHRGAQGAMTEIGDIVLFHYEGKPTFFARIEDINADVKPGWFSVRFQILTLPLSETSIILKPEYIDGAEFTMGGVPVRLEKVERLAPLVAPAPEKEKAEKGGGKVVALSSRKRPGDGGG